MLVDQALVDCRREAIDPLIADWRARFPEVGVLALLPEAEKHHLPALQESCRSLHVPLLGAIFPALIAADGFIQQGVCLIGFKQFPAHFTVAASDALGQSVSTAAQQLLAAHPATDGTPTLFLMFDGMLPNIASILHALHAAIGTAANCTGVNAGSESFQPMPCLFDHEQVFGAGVIGLLLPAQVRSAVRHGYPVSKSLMNATSTSGNRIDRINNRPAFDVYQEVIAAEYGVALTRSNFYDHAVHFPFGLVTVLDILVRIPVALTDDGALFCVGEVPPNALLKLLRAPTLEKSNCVRDIAEQMLEAPKAQAEQPLLTFYCAGRRMHFGEESATELQQLQESTGVPALFGALTLGEIDSIEELNLLPRFHNACVVCIQL